MAGRPERSPGTSVRRAAAAATAVVALVLLVGCMPIEYNTDTGVTTSHAEWRVIPTTVNGKNAIEIRFRHCNSVTITGKVVGDPVSAHLRPAAMVKDAKGKRFFDTTSQIGDLVQPAGSKVIDNTSDGDDLQRIIVPVAGASGAVTITPACGNWTSPGRPAFIFAFGSCTTTNRTCATRTYGTGYLSAGV